MPLSIKHIDKIAREKNRSVVFVSVEPPENTESFIFKNAPNHVYHDWETDVNRQGLIEWLEENNIGWEPCGHIACETGWIAYSGNIYIDVPFDETDPNYIKVQTRLENSDGTPKNPQVKFWLVDLQDALENAHHDEPGFWDKWAENF